jgi:diguanylate cyclase (GGDEF)-like protein
MIAQQAADALGLSRSERKGLSVSSRLIAGTNILEISVQGNSPTLVRDYANAIGAKTVDYVRSLYEAFELSPLDEATLPGSPINSNEVLNLVLGGIVGLVLGMGLAFLTDYLRTSQEGRTNFDIVDVETGTHNRRYFMLRLQQELSRARRNGYPLSVALLDVNHPGAFNGSSSQVRAEALREVASLIEPHLRDEDVMARFNDTTFAVLLPDMSGEVAKRTIEELRLRIGRTPVEIASSGLKLNIQGAAGVVAFGGNGTGQDEFLAQATQALEIAETTTHGRVCLYSEVNDRH